MDFRCILAATIMKTPEQIIIEELLGIIQVKVEQIDILNKKISYLESTMRKLVYCGQPDSLTIAILNLLAEF